MTDTCVRHNFPFIRKKKMSLIRTIQNGTCIYFQYVLNSLKLEVDHGALQLINLIDMSIKINR